MKKVIVLAGPTASGKTSLSLKLAKKLNLEIINGDAVAIYERLDIGSAKPTEAEQNGIKHHLLSIAKAGSDYSVYEYQRAIRSLIDKIDIPFIVGGSGFYIKSSLYNYEFDDEKALDLSVYTLDEMNQEIKLKDPNFKYDDQNRRRVEGAFRILKSGSLPSQKKRKNEPLYDVLVLYLDMPRDKQEALMQKRLDLQLEAGLLEEVKALRADGIIIRDIIGYRELNLYLDQKISLEEAKALIIKTTYRLAKKQRTWFLNQMNPVMLDPFSKTLVEDTAEKILRFLKS